MIQGYQPFVSRTNSNVRIGAILTTGCLRRQSASETNTKGRGLMKPFFHRVLTALEVVEAIDTVVKIVELVTQHMHLLVR
jgi:hypothetical protein